MASTIVSGFGVSRWDVPQTLWVPGLRRTGFLKQMGKESDGVTNRRTHKGGVGSECNFLVELRLIILQRIS